MFPILIDFGTYDLPWLGQTHLFLPTYGFLFAMGVVAAWIWFMRRARRMGLPEEKLFNLTFYSLLAGILGAKLLLIALDWYMGRSIDLLGTLRSAGVLVGGVIAGAVTFAWYCRHSGLPLFALGDAVAAPLALAQGLGRLGCLSAGCCWGKQIDPSNPLALEFTRQAAHDQTGVPLNTPLFPTQPTEAILDLALVVLLTVLWRRGVRVPGTVFWIYVLLYSLGRGIIEFWRGDRHRGLFLGDAVSTSQLIAIGGIVFASIMLLRGIQVRRKARAS